MCSEVSSLEDRHHTDRGMRPDSVAGSMILDQYFPSHTSSHHQNIPEELANLLITMIPGRRGEELAEAFREASEVPPVTKRSLSELDMYSVITNIKLRHDVNFDRDLSFRPNLDGAKGQEKNRVASNYWTALVAELMLYERLYWGTRPLQFEQTQLESLMHHVERRIPTMFQTIAHVLKSLVPDRDHARVDEHVDVAMLMQEIERGVCDLVRFAEWMARLLKEHCAPMRDEWVDDMVRYIREGVTSNDPGMIVQGLRELLGILEAMKLDVANHQIRNLKTLLIEDTINFEKYYHLDRLVNGRSRVNIHTAHSWYADAVAEFGHECLPRHRNVSRFQREALVRVVVATLFERSARSEFPETFYLDHDRLRTLKAELTDITCFEICTETCEFLAKEFGYEGTQVSTGQNLLHASIQAIMGEAMCHGALQWSINSEAISLEILRHASRLAGSAPTAHFDRWAKVNEHVQRLFTQSSTSQANRIEALLLPLVLSYVERSTVSSPIELYNTVVSNPASLFCSSSFQSPWQLQNSTVLTPCQTITSLHLTSLAQRIAHIITLHWRTWGSIVYVQDDNQSNDMECENTISSSPLTPSSKECDAAASALPCQTQSQPPPLSTNAEHAGVVVASRPCTASQNAGHETTQVSRRTSSQ